MPMSLKKEIRLLSMVDILGPLSDEELEEAARWVAGQDAAPEFGAQLRQAVAYVAGHGR